MFVFIRSAVAVFSLSLSVHYAIAEKLITEEEAKRPDRPINTSATRGGITPGPTITLIAPTPVVAESHSIKANAIQAPFTLKLEFTAHSGNSIDWDTFKATYLKEPAVALTDRLRAHLVKDGILFADAEVPPGNHQILLEVTDSAKRKTWTILTLANVRP